LKISFNIVLLNVLGLIIYIAGFLSAVIYFVTFYIDRFFNSTDQYTVEEFTLFSLGIIIFIPLYVITTFQAFKIIFLITKMEDKDKEEFDKFHPNVLKALLFITAMVIYCSAAFFWLA